MKGTGVFSTFFPYLTGIAYQEIPKRAFLQMLSRIKRWYYENKWGDWMYELRCAEALYMDLKSANVYSQRVDHRRKKAKTMVDYHKMRLTEIPKARIVK